MPIRMSELKSMWNAPNSTAALLCLTVLFLSGCNQSSSDGFKTIAEGDIKVATVDETQLKNPEVEPNSVTSKKVEVLPTPNPMETGSPDSTKAESNDGKKTDATNALDEPREIKLLIKEKNFQSVGPEGALRVSYDDIDLLKVLNMEKAIPEAVDYFPNWLNELDGKRVRIRGFMYPLKASGIKNFLLTRDTKVCCFGPKAKIYDRFPVRMKKGTTTDYIYNRPFDVVGIFRIDPLIDEGENYKDILELYRIEDAIIIQ